MDDAAQTLTRSSPSDLVSVTLPIPLTGAMLLIGPTVWMGSRTRCGARGGTKTEFPDDGGGSFGPSIPLDVRLPLLGLDVDPVLVSSAAPLDDPRLGRREIPSSSGGHSLMGGRLAKTPSARWLSLSAIPPGKDGTRVVRLRALSAAAMFIPVYACPGCMALLP